MKLFFHVVLVISMLARFAVAQSEWLTPPPTLVLAGVPSIPASFSKSLLRYRISSPDVLIGWDPIRIEPIFIRERPAGPSFVATVASPGESARMTFASRGDETYNNPRKGYLVFEADASSGADRMQLLRYNPERNSTVRLTDGISTNYHPVFSNSGEAMMYSSNRRDGKHMDLYIINPLDPRSDRMIAQTDGEGWAALDWSPDDSKVILSDQRSANESDLWILDVATGTKTRLTTQPVSGKVFNGRYAQFSGDAKGVYHITDRESDFHRLAYVDIDTKRYTYIAEANWDVEEFALSPDRRLLAFTTNEEGFSRLHILDTSESNREISLPAMRRGVVERLRWHNRGTHIAFGFSSATVPGDIYSVEVGTGKLQHWTNTARAESEESAEPELIKWKSFDGKLIPGFLYRPPGKPAGRRPVVINVHGGPESQFRPGFRGTDNYFTAELGAVMIHPNIRGSMGYGKAYLASDNGYLRQDAIKDIGALLDWIKDQPDLDPGRVLIRGGSYGGYVALSVAVNYSDRIIGAISHSGPSNLVTHLQRTDISRQDRRREEYGDERDSKMRKFLESIAPFKNADRVKRPLLVLHGKNDTAVASAESEQMAAAVRRRGILVWQVLALHEGHSRLTDSDWTFWLSIQAMFTKSLLAGEPLPH